MDNRKLYLVVLLLCSLVCYCQAADITFYSSLSFNASLDTSFNDDINQKSLDLQKGVQLAFDQINKNPYRTGCLYNNTLKLVVMDDSNDPLRTNSNINNIINLPDSEFLGMIFSNDADSATLIQSRLAPNNIPFVSPLSPNMELRKGGARNALNLLSSVQDYIVTIVQYVHYVQGKDRIALYYSNDATGQQALQLAGIALSSFNVTLVVNATHPAGQPYNAAQSASTIYKSNPEVVIIWSSSYSASQYFIPAFRDLDPTRSIPILSSYLPAIFNYLNTNQTADMYLISMPLVNQISTSELVVDFHNALYADSNITTPTGNTTYVNGTNPVNSNNNNTVPSPISRYISYNNSNDPKLLFQGHYSQSMLAGYMTGIYVANIVSRMNRLIGVNRANFLDTLYSAPLVYISDYLLGPISDVNCVNVTNSTSDVLPQIFPCCNQLSHVASVAKNRIENGKNLEYQVDSLTTWKDCNAQINILAPISIGTIYDPNDPYSAGVRQGLLIAFDHFNTDPTRQGLATYQLIDYASPDVQNNTYLLNQINLTSIVALAGIPDHLLRPYIHLLPSSKAIVGPLSQSAEYRHSSTLQFVNIEASVVDEVTVLMRWILNTTYTKILFFYEVDELNIWKEVNNAVDNQLKNFTVWYELAEYANTSNPINKLILNHEKLDVRSAYSTDTNYNYDTDIDLVILFSTRPQAAINFFYSWAAAIGPDFSNLLSRVEVGQIASRYDPLYIIQQISPILNLTHIGATTYLPFASISPTGLPFEILSSFYNNTETCCSPGQLFNTSMYEGYILGLFINEVVDNINGVVDPVSFLSTIYRLGTVPVQGQSYGAFSGNPKESTGCNQGAQFVTYIRRDSLSSTPLLTDVWKTTCGREPFDFMKVNPNYIPPSDDNRSDTSIIIGSVLGSVFLVLILIGLCVVGLLVLLILWKYFNKSETRKKQFLEHPPKFQNFGILERFLDKTGIDEYYLSATIANAEYMAEGRSRTSFHSESNISGKPSSSSHKDKPLPKRVESFLLMDPRIPIVIITALTKAGIAREQITAAMVYIYFFNGQDRIQELIQAVIDKEIAQAENESLLFREDSILASIWFVYTKLVGLPFIWRVLAEPLFDISEIFYNKRMLQDSKRGSSGSGARGKSGVGGKRGGKRKRSLNEEEEGEEMEDIFVNRLHLKLAGQSIFTNLKTHTEYFPQELHFVLEEIQKKLKDTFPELTLGVIANYVISRYVCSAVQNPSGYGIEVDKKQKTKKYSEKTQGKNLRFLVIVGKLLMNLGFGVEFENSEEMEEMNDFIEQNKSGMTKFLEEISKKEYMNSETEGSGKVEVYEWIKNNCVKWVYGNMYYNRQLVRREMKKKIKGDLWEKVEEELELLGIIRGGTSSDSMTTTPSATEGSGEREDRMEESSDTTETSVTAHSEESK